MNRRFVIGFLLLWPIAAVVFSFAIRTSTLGSVILFLGVPALLLSTQLPRKTALKAMLFSATVAIPSIIVIDAIAESMGQWVVPQSILPFRFFGSVTLEILLWGLCNFYGVIAFYKAFLDRTRDRRIIRPRLLRLVATLLVISTIFAVLNTIHPAVLAIPYFYLVFGLACILVPTILELARHPALAGKFFITGVYFFYLTLAYEFSALSFGWWGFPAHQYIGWISFLSVQFPFEELVFWMMLFSIAILSLYEHFDEDDR